MFPLLCCPNPPRLEGCRRTQQTNGRRWLTTELANDAVNSLIWLGGHKNSSHPPRLHVESMDKKHSALWGHLCDEALRAKKTTVSLWSGVDDCPHIFDVVGSTGRRYLKEQKRMRRDPEEIEGVTLPQVHNDPVLKRNRKLYHSFV